jgi:hypothetical protein
MGTFSSFQEPLFWAMKSKRERRVVEAYLLREDLECLLTLTHRKEKGV